MPSFKIYEYAEVCIEHEIEADNLFEALTLVEQSDGTPSDITNTDESTYSVWEGEIGNRECRGLFQGSSIEGWSKKEED